MRTWFLLLAGSCCVLGACAGATPGDTTPIKVGGGSGAVGPNGKAADVALDLGSIELKGVFYEPLALGRPGVPLVQAKQKMSLDKHRQAMTKAKDPVVKQAEAAIIATMLYEQSKSQSGDAQQKTTADARQTLRDVATAVGNDVDELTLHSLGSYDLLLLDFASAEKDWGQLVATQPKAKDEPTNRAWWVYSLLAQGKNKEALDNVADPTPLSEKQPELAYVTAWAKWRAGDNAGAWSALLLAIKGWGQMTNKDQLDFETLVIAGHSNIPMAQQVKDLQPLLAGKDQTLAYKLQTDLGLRAYAVGGRWTDAIAALEKALDIEGNKTPPQDVVKIRYSEADFVVRLDDPATATKYAKQGLDALTSCGAKCTDKDKAGIIDSLHGLAKLFYIVYATAHDDRYYQPAHDLYDIVIPAFATDKEREPAVIEKNELERWQKNLSRKEKAGDGTHDKGAVTALVKSHNEEVQSCYEVRLSANKNLAGPLVVNLESDQTGAIKGVSTEPKAGMADMSAVAGCVAERARGWRLPKTANGTGPTHSTRLKITYALTKK